MQLVRKFHTIHEALSTIIVFFRGCHWHYPQPAKSFSNTPPISFKIHFEISATDMNDLLWPFHFA
jgi:hypothetical protein